jgi:hypothetical protein
MFNVHYDTQLPNVATKWLTLLLHIVVALVSNLGPEIGYPDTVFMIFLSPSRQMSG